MFFARSGEPIAENANATYNLALITAVRPIVRCTAKKCPKSDRRNGGAVQWRKTTRQRSWV